MLPEQSQNSLTGPTDEVHGSQFKVRLRWRQVCSAGACETIGCAKHCLINEFIWSGRQGKRLRIWDEDHRSIFSCFGCTVLDLWNWICRASFPDLWMWATNDNGCSMAGMNFIQWTCDPVPRIMRLVDLKARQIIG